MNTDLESHKIFRAKLAEKTREELLEIIQAQNPYYIKQINRIEYVFRHLMGHLTDENGVPYHGRDLTNEDLIKLIDPPFIFSKEMAQEGFNEQQQRQLHIASDPVLWAKAFLPVKPRVYQTLLLREENPKRVLRLGRRMGKTMVLSILALWYAYTHHEGNVLVIAPMKTHVGLIYKEVTRLIEKSAQEKSELLAKAIVRSVTAPQYEIEFSNGSAIRFFTTGMKNNSKTNVARGQDADIIILDEMDYMAPDDLNALYAMLQDTNEAKVGLKKLLIGASTPSGLRETFWEWNTNPKFKFTAFYFPAYANPLWTAETEEEMHIQYRDPNVYKQEVEADWGEPGEGVYPRRHVDNAFQGDWIYDLSSFNVEWESEYIMGVDWDKYGAGVNIVILEICGPNHTQSPGMIRLVHREEVDKGEFTYTIAVERIVELNEIFNFSHIYVDRGAGEMQLETLKKYGMNHPHTRFHIKVKGFQFRENIEVRDPYTMMPVKKEVKAFMIDNLYRMLESGRLIFTEEDDEMYFQLISYIVIRTSAYGTPIFGPGGGAVDHAHDALILACLAIAENYDELLKVKYAYKPLTKSNEAFLPLFNAETPHDMELVEDKWDGIENAPVMRKRTGVNRRMSRRNRMIRRPMIR